MAQIPTIDVHRGVGIHDNQPPARIKLVRAAIDIVARMSDVTELAEFAADAMQPPESRLFAAGKIEAGYQISAEERRNRPAIDLDRVRATVAGLDEMDWRDPDRFASLLDCGDAVLREHSLADE
jgi:hypothetical protein